MNKKIDTIIGTPQGSVLSPILANIYLHEFDKFMMEKVNLSLDSGSTSKRFKPYRLLEAKINYIYQLERKNGSLTNEQVKSLKKLTIERNKLPSTIGGPGYHIYYVRYADDFLIGINGKRTLALQLKSEINEFLTNTLKLTMSVEKTKVTNIKDDYALFLGAEIHRLTSRNNNSKVISKQYSSGNFNSRVANSRTSLLIPVKYVIKKLANQNFCEIKDYNQGKITPKGKTAWINLSLKDIVLRYNAVLRGIVNYYSFAANRARLQFVQFILQHSCAKLIARKLKLHSRAQVFKKFGSNLQIVEGTGKSRKSVSLKLANSYKQIVKFNINPSVPLEEVYWSLRTKSKLNECCVICKSTENVQMHHIKALKSEYNKKVSGFTKVMIAMNRKQIPVCQNCHIKIHKGLYDGLNLKSIK